MGIGKTLKIVFTQQVKCDRCGDVIVDGTFNSKPKYRTDNLGNTHKIPSYGGDGVGVLNTLVYGNKKKNLCRMCKTLERNNKEFGDLMAKEREEGAEQEALHKEKLRLENELLKQKIKNETMSNSNSTASNEHNTGHKAKRVNNFCSSCGNALKPNAQFCSQCGKRIG